METCDCDVQQFQQKVHLRQAHHAGGPSLWDMRAQCLSPVVHIFAARFPPRMG